MDLSKRNITFIVNPNAGNGRARKIWDSKVEKLLNEYKNSNHFADYKVLFTKKQGDAGELAIEECKNLNQGDVLVSVGGDGTNNEVLNGFIKGEGNKKGISYSTVSLGTGCDFVRTLATSDVDIAIESIATGYTLEIDIGQIVLTDHNNKLVTKYFINGSGAGMNGHVCELVNLQSFYKSVGAIGFLIAALKGICFFGDKGVRYRFSENEPWKSERIMNFIVMNGIYAGGGMKFTENALLNDGSFDYCIMQEMAFSKKLKVVGALHEGKHKDMPHIVIGKAKTIEIEPTSSAKVPIEIDGESPGTLPAKWTVKPKFLRLVCLEPTRKKQVEKEMAQRLVIETRKQARNKMILAFTVAPIVITLALLYFGVIKLF